MADNVVPLGPSRAETHAREAIEPWGDKGDGLANIPVSIIRGLLGDIDLWRKAALLRQQTLAGFDAEGNRVATLHLHPDTRNDPHD